jgi:hypothetical protein
MASRDPIPELRRIFDVYMDIVAMVEPSGYRQRPPLRLPAIPPPLLAALVDLATERFKSEPMVLVVSTPVIVIGELSGSLFDLLRILHMFGVPPCQSYLVTGNVVDCGEFSMETLMLLLLLKLFHPDSIHLLRGRREFFDPLVVHDTFLIELRAQCSDSKFGSDLMTMFMWMPIAAVVMRYAFVSHTGVPSVLGPLSDLNRIERPVETFEPKLIEYIMWSEPSEDSPEVIPLPCGLGVLYGIRTVERFLQRTSLSVVICGHRPLRCGACKCLGGLVVRVFSGSGSYCTEKLQSAVVEVHDGGCSERILPPLGTIRRSHVRFTPLRRGEIRRVESLNSVVLDGEQPQQTRPVTRTPQGSTSRCMTLKAVLPPAVPRMRRFTSEKPALPGGGLRAVASLSAGPVG